MSEKRLTIFPQESTNHLPDEKLLTKQMVEMGFIQRKNDGYYILCPDFVSLLDQKETQLDDKEEILVWLEYFDEACIQIGSDSQYMECVRTPDHKRVLGDLDIAYELIGELEANMEAEYVDHDTGEKYKIRELDFQHYLGYGKSFIHIDRYLKPTEEFINKLEDVLGLKLNHSMFWL